MTCIVAITDGSRIVMGADTGGVNYAAAEYYEISMPKVFHAGEDGAYLVGYAGSYRLGQLLHYELSWPELGETFDYPFVVKEIVPRIRACLEEHSEYGRPKSAGEREWIIVVGALGKIFTVSCHFDVLQSKKNYVSIGKGRLTAIGSLATTEKLESSPGKRIEVALDAAATVIPGILRPYKIIGSDRKSEAFPAASDASKSSLASGCKPIGPLA